MNLLYEANRSYKVGHIIADTEQSYWIQTPENLSIKIKKDCVDLIFSEPFDNFLEIAQQLSDKIDIKVLWNIAGEQTSSLLELAECYFGKTPSSLEKAALLLCLRTMPMYFYKCANSYFKPATKAALTSALVSIEKKILAKQQIEAWSQALLKGDIPETIKRQWWSLLHQPDKQSIEYRALEIACKKKGCTLLQLALELGAFHSISEYLLDGFLLKYFPMKQEKIDLSIDHLLDELPLTAVDAFSIDDEGTIEIDDAFSLNQLSDGSYRIGIHIALPAIGAIDNKAIEAIVFKRCSTVYLPNQKITMLPNTLIECFSLIAGKICPTMSLYLDVDAQHKIYRSETKLEKIIVKKNFTPQKIEALLNNQLLDISEEDELFDFKKELIWLLQFSLSLQKKYTQRSVNTFQKFDYSVVFRQQKIIIRERQRGSAVDQLVSGLMVLANCTWSQLLATQHVIAMYRTQSTYRSRTTLNPMTHTKLGVPQYAWCTSPLRRAVDFINQCQLIALLRHENLPYSNAKKTLSYFARYFDKTYDAYLVFQRQMTRCYALRWILQENLKTICGVHIGRGVFKLEHLPLHSQPIKSLDSLNIGDQIVFDILMVDEITQSIELQPLSQTS